MKPISQKINKRIRKIKSFSLIPQALKKSRSIITHKTPKRIIVVSLFEHIGDIVASEPVDRYLKTTYPDAYIIRVTSRKYQEILQHNPNIDQIITVDSFGEWVYIKRFLRLFSRIKIVDMHFNKKFCSDYRVVLSNPVRKDITQNNYFNTYNLLETFSLIGGLPLLNERPVYYLPPQIKELNIPKPYVVVHIKSNDAGKEWGIENWNMFVSYLINKDFTVVEIDLKQRITCDHPNFIAASGRLSFTEIAFLIKNATFFVGIDSAFAHFANAFEVPRLVMLGHHWGFTQYLPYSGMNEEEQHQYLLYHDGPVREISQEEVIAKTNKILNIN